MKNLVEELREAAKSSGMSQTELARRLGITQPSISLFFSGGGISGVVLAALMEVLEYKVVRPRKPK